MSKERARRRAEREAARAAAEAARLRRLRRRQRWAALVRRLTPRRRRRAWGLGRRSPAQRAIIAGVGILLLLPVWFLVDSWPNRIGLSVLVLLLLPVVAVVAFDRKGMRL
jgi:Flp pilus assembly protein TadB